MAVFNVSFLNPKMRKRSGGGAGVGILVDQLAILENDLGRDGYLAPGDYDLLVEQAQKAMLNPALTASQRSNFNVKISNYEKAKAVLEVEQKSDIPTILRDIKNERADDIMRAGNNPKDFLERRRDSYFFAIDILREEMERRENDGMDSSEYRNELIGLERSYNDIYGALGEVNKNKGEMKGYAAYVDADPNTGEIIDIDYRKIDNRSGYIETNGMIGGFKVFGKPNTNIGDTEAFKLGEIDFLDTVVKDDGQGEVTWLPSNKRKFWANGNEGGDTVEFMKSFEKEEGVMDVKNPLIVQSHIPPNSYRKGQNGSIYHRRKDGGYTKYINTTEDILGMKPGEIPEIPSMIEKSIGRYVDDVVPGSERIASDLDIPSQNIGFGTGGAPMSVEPQQQPANLSPSLSRTKQPIERASTDAMDTANRTDKGAWNLVKKIFRKPPIDILR